MNRRQLYIFDCLTGKLRVSDGDFMTIGQGNKNTFRATMEFLRGGVFAQRNGICRFFPAKELKSFSVNGCELSGDFLVKPDTHFLCVMGGGCFIAWYGNEKDRPDFSRFDPRIWYIYTPETREWSEAKTLLDLPASPEAANAEALATFEGLGYYAFRLADMVKVANFVAHTGGAVHMVHTQGATPKGLFRCPACWATFSKEEAPYVATHPQLCGDEHLGPNARQRFIPTEAPEQGYATDALGSLCHEQACPYCHHKLPPFFAEAKHHIFSLVGGAGSGKSCYLAALVHELERFMPREFGLPFRDADPEVNAPLNDMRMRIFATDCFDPDHAAHTYLKESLYRKVWKDGMYRDMPRPFIYTLSKGSGAHSVVLYNHAAKTCAETNNCEHLKVTDAIFYHFDPTSDLAFRAVLRDSDIPQQDLPPTVTGEQNTLLGDMEIKLRSALQLPAGQKVNTPLAVIIGKCDFWRTLLGPEPLLPSVRNGEIKPANIAANSARLRELLFRICPNICTNAEAVSDNVCYFAASALGASPVSAPETGSPENQQPGHITPFRVSDPFIWALSSLEPELFPGTNS